MNPLTHKLILFIYETLQEKNLNSEERVYFAEFAILSQVIFKKYTVQYSCTSTQSQKELWYLENIEKGQKSVE